MNFVNINKAGGTRLPRMVTNQAPINMTALSDRVANVFSAGTGSASAVAGDPSLIELRSGASGSAYLAVGGANIPLTAGRYYAVSVEVAAITGSLSGFFMTMQGATAPTEGVVNTSKQPTVGRAMMFFKASTTENVDLRFGIVGTNTDVTVQLRNLMFQEMTDASELAPYTPPLLKTLLPFTDTGYWDSSNDTYVSGDRTPYEIGDSALGIVISDSFCNTIESDEYGNIINDDLAYTAVYVNGVSGRTLETVADEINTILGDTSFQQKYVTVSDHISPVYQEYYGQPKFAVIGLGVNSINVNGSATNNPIPSMQASIKTIAARCEALSIKPIFLNTAPWAGSALFSAALDNQIQTDTWNGWLESYCKTNGYGYVDIYSALEGDATPDTLSLIANGDSVTYDSGDGLHPNTAGAQVIADAIKPFIRRL